MERRNEGQKVATILRMTDNAGKALEDLRRSAHKIAEALGAQGSLEYIDITREGVGVWCDLVAICKGIDDLRRLLDLISSVVGLDVE